MRIYHEGRTVSWDEGDEGCGRRSARPQGGRTDRVTAAREDRPSPYSTGPGGLRTDIEELRRMVQAAMLREVIAAHLTTAVPRLFDPPRTPDEFRRPIRSYTRLVDLVAVSDSDVAERRRRRHVTVSAEHMVPGAARDDTVELLH